MGERRRFLMETKACLAEVDSWFFSNESEVVLIMDEFRRRWWSGLVGGSIVHPDNVLSSDNRTLSEMPICWSLKYVARDFPLSGFEFISPRDGWVKVGRKMMGRVFSWSTFHGYLLSKNLGVVACLTFAQFALPYDSLPKGGRISYVVNLAPELVVKGENGLAVLRGTIDEIHKKTGLKYSLRNERVVEF